MATQPSDTDTPSALDPNQAVLTRLSSLESQLDAIILKYNSNKTAWSQDTFKKISNNQRINAIDEYMKFLVGNGKITESQPDGQVVLPDTSNWPAEGLFSRATEAVKDYSDYFFTKNPSESEFLTPYVLVGRLENGVQKLDEFFSGLGNVSSGLADQVNTSKDKAIKSEADATAEWIYLFLTGETFNAGSLLNISENGTFGSGYIGSIESMLSESSLALSELKESYAARAKGGKKLLSAAFTSFLCFAALGGLFYLGTRSLSHPSPAQEPTATMTGVSTQVPPTDVFIPLSISCKGGELVRELPNQYACGNAVDGNINGSSYGTNDFSLLNDGTMTLSDDHDIPDIALRLLNLIPVKDAELRLYWGREGAFEYDITLFDSTAANLGTVTINAGSPWEIYPRNIGYLDTHGAPYLDRLRLGEVFAGLGSDVLEKELYSIVISPVKSAQFFNADDESISYSNELVLYEAQVADIGANK